MIEVAFFRREGDLIGFEASGHAGYDEYGRDIVCAAVSAVLLTTLDAIQSLVKAKPRIQRNDRKGFLQVMLPLEMEEAVKHDSLLLLQAAENGLSGIAQQYPEFVRIISRNRR